MAVQQVKVNGVAVRGKYLVRIRRSGVVLYQKTLSNTTRAQALQHEAEKRLELGAGAPGSPTRRSGPGFTTFCVSTYKPHAKQTLSEQTWRNRKYQVAELCLYFDELPLDKFTTKRVYAYRKARAAAGVGPAKINDDVSKLLTILRFAQEMGRAAAVPKVKRLAEPKTKGRVMVWTAEQVSRLLAAMHEHAPHLVSITEVLLNTGLRKGEAMRLEWHNVDIARRLLNIHPNEEWRPKSNRAREVPINDAALRWLDVPPAERLHPRWVFPHPGRRGRFGQGYSAPPDRWKRWPQRAWDAARDAAKVGGSPHVCRHTYASHFLAAKPDLFLLARVLGHTHTEVTELYSHLLPDYLAQARDVVDLRERAPAWQILARVAETAATRQQG